MSQKPFFHTSFLTWNFSLFSNPQSKIGVLIWEKGLTSNWPWKFTSRSKLMVQSNVALGPGQPSSEPFFRRWSILEDISDYRLKWVTVYIDIWSKWKNAQTLFYYHMQYIFFPVSSGCNHARLEMFRIIKSYCGVVYPPKIFLIKLTKSHSSFFIVRTLFEFVWLWKILLLYVKQLNGYLVPHFSGVVITPSKPFWARQK